MLLGFFYCAQLLEHSKHVPIYPTLGDLSVCDAINRHAGPTGASACGGNAHNFALLRAARNEVSRDQIAFRDLCQDSVLEIGKGLMKAGNKLFPGVESSNCVGATGMMLLMVDIIACKNLLQILFASLRPELDGATRQILVLR